jgi:predicted unusual protein kinase regulating ubiquinone biosynthesis (AarF/ABC1/UbiB family)
MGMAGRTAGEAVAASLRKRRHPEADLTEFHTRQAQRYAERLGNSRGVLMKAGQMLSFVTLDPAVEAPYRGIYQAAFARLLDDAPPMPPRLAVEVITAELGRPPRELFAEFDPTPLAAASIGQVHAARLHDGRAVAVKVQYPGVEEAIRTDLANTELLATFLQMLFTVMPGLSRMDVRAVAREVADRMGEEIDYRAEANNQQEFADLYRGHPFIRVPEVVPEFSTRRVLTAELSDGIRYAKALTAEQSLRDAWGEAVYRFFSANLVLHGLFNADPHPGNYLFHPDGKVTFLDFGCVKRFTAQQVVNMDELVHAIVSQDADRLYSATSAAGFIDPKDPPSAAALLAVMVDYRADLISPQPYTYTPENCAQALRACMSPRGPHGATIRKMSGAGEYVFITRVDTGMTAVLGGLHATGPWWAIRQEYSDGAPPATRYGELDLGYRSATR